MRQILFKILEGGTTHAGFLLENGDVVCGCCGEIFEADEVEILEDYFDWVDLQTAIIENRDLSKYLKEPKDEKTYRSRYRRWKTYNQRR